MKSSIYRLDPRGRVDSKPIYYEDTIPENYSNLINNLAEVIYTLANNTSRYILEVLDKDKYDGYIFTEGGYRKNVFTCSKYVSHCTLEDLMSSLNDIALSK